jgi:hypothetical protein
MKELRFSIVLFRFEDDDLEEYIPLYQYRNLNFEVAGNLFSVITDVWCAVVVSLQFSCGALRLVTVLQ